MKNPCLLALLLLASPFAALAQTKSTTTTTTKPTSTTTTTTPAGTQQQVEVTEDLDPETGKVIRRTTRTINVPVGTTTSPASSAGSSSTMDSPATAATDAQVSTFLRKKTTVSTLTTTGLLSAYDLFIERVRNDRQNWKPADWATAANIMSSLNDRYQQLRGSFSLDDKLTIRSQQGEFQALRTAKQISTQVSDKL
ncbi:hypothetical protein ACFP2F_17840 [Hymenobacter artigasi]|uniref:Uncharacterized protein n=1 Tax=Hymenobacter artigasi TaxID=2719616 RepID=A0ABX1HN14_9BACT|nr:hypothetical protein [Hymenobacter artigasi]NKI91195.1 hypothetical protein [Hymenobacter artigasi]